jgi:hypothetical protein
MNANLIKALGAMVAVIVGTLGIAEPAVAAPKNWTTIGGLHHQGRGVNGSGRCQVELYYESHIPDEGAPVYSEVDNGNGHATSFSVTIPARDSGNVVDYTTVGWTNPSGTITSAGDYLGSTWAVSDTGDSDHSISWTFNLPPGTSGDVYNVDYGTAPYGHVTVQFYGNFFDNHCFFGQ